MKVIFGGGGATPTAKMLVADHDRSVVGYLLMGAFRQGELADLVEIENVSESEGRQRMEEGKASGLLIIPEGLTGDVLNGESTHLQLITNPSQRILPGILEETLGTLVDGLNGIQSILENSASPLLDQIRNQQGSPSDAQVAEVSVTVNRLIQRAEPYLLPPAIEVEMVIEEERNGSSRGFGEIFFPSMFFLAIVFAAQGLSHDVWTERVLGTLRRTVTTPGRLPVFLAGKLAAGGVVLALVSIIALSAGRWVLGIPFQGVPLAALWATLTGVFMLLLFTLIQLLAGSQRGGNLLTSGILFPLVMVGGAFFPFEVMPDWLAGVGRLTPNGWALVRFKEIVSGETDPRLLAITVAGLLAVGTAIYFLSWARLSRFARG
jgi:ABC-type Na+ efflux pump permease subunit